MWIGIFDYSRNIFSLLFDLIEVLTSIRRQNIQHSGWSNCSRNFAQNFPNFDQADQIKNHRKNLCSQHPFSRLHFLSLTLRQHTHTHTRAYIFLSPSLEQGPTGEDLREHGRRWAGSGLEQGAQQPPEKAQLCARQAVRAVCHQPGGKYPGADQQVGPPPLQDQGTAPAEEPNGVGEWGLLSGV